MVERIEVTEPGSYDIQSEWDARGPGERDAYLADLANQGYQVPSLVDLDSGFAPTIGAPQLPPSLRVILPTQGPQGPASRGVQVYDQAPGPWPLVYDQPPGPNAPGAPSFLPSIDAGAGSGIASGLGGLLPGLGLGPNLSLGLGGVWNVLWWAALGYALYSGVRHVPRKSELSTALINGGLAGAVMGFASDRASRS